MQDNVTWIALSSHSLVLESRALWTIGAQVEGGVVAPATTQNGQEGLYVTLATHGLMMWIVLLKCRGLILNTNFCKNKKNNSTGKGKSDGGSEWLNALQSRAVSFCCDKELRNNIGLCLGVSLQFVMSAPLAELRLVQLQHNLSCKKSKGRFS